MKYIIDIINDLITCGICKQTNPLPSSYLQDIEGNIYTTIIVGSQEWIIENFKCTKYSDGSSISNVILNATWLADVTGAYCWYNNDPATYKIPYGALYNWYSATNVKGLVYLERGGVQEVGWRIPTDTDFNILVAYLGGAAVAGGKLKESTTTHWAAPNTGADNSSGLTFVGASFRNWNGVFDPVPHTESYIWSSTDGGMGTAGSLLMFNDDIITQIGTIPCGIGACIRLVR